MMFRVNLRLVQLVKAYSQLNGGRFKFSLPHVIVLTKKKILIIIQTNK